ARVAEPALLGGALSAAGVPVVARLAGAARADGGDFIWLDEHTMLAGRSYRTGAEGLRQLAQILAAEGARLERVDLPHDRGPGHVLHLMSLISPIADDLAVVYPPLAPVALMEMLGERGIRVVAVGTDEYETMRSEEHTSELQSLTNLVCRLLLEKKKNDTLTYTAL